MERPRTLVERAIDLVGEGPRLLPFVSEKIVEFGVNHDVGGNPSRFRTGAVELRPDREWAARMRRRDRRLVTALTLPFLSRFGYSA